MNTTCQFLPVLLSAIDMEDRTYCFTSWEDAPSMALLRSIRRFGILHPPILRCDKDQTYCVVAGRKRLAVAHHLAPDVPVFCRIIPTDLEETTIFSLLLEEAATGTPLTPAEQIIFFEKLLLVSSMEKAIPMLEQLGYKPQKHILMDLLELRSLSEHVQQALHYGTINIKNAKKLLKFSKADQETIIQLITDLYLGGSKQLKLIELCTELILRKNIPLQEILSEFQHAHKPEDPMNVPQQASALLSWLHNGCYPLTSKAGTSFKQKVARLDLPSTMQISHTPAFEDEKTTLSISFPEWGHLEIMVKEIKKLLQEK